MGSITFLQFNFAVDDLVMPTFILETVLEKEVEFGLEDDALNSDYDERVREARKHCDCLQPCTSLSYNAESSQAFFNWQQVFLAFKGDPNEFPG